jgi:hypothetical protein
VFLLVALFFGATTGGHLRLSVDGVGYTAIATHLQHGDFSDIVTAKQASFTYAAFTGLIALARAIAPAHWQLLMLILNVISAALTGALLVNVTRRITGSAYAAAAALVLYLACWDVIFWVPYLLTDAEYTPLAMLAFSLVIDGVVGRERPFRRTKVALVAVLAAITRVLGVVTLPVAAAIEWLLVARRTAAARRALWITFAAGVLVAFIAHAWFFQDMRRWPFFFSRGKLTDYAAREHRGEVVVDRPETYHRPPSTMADHVSIEVDRFFRFFQATSSTYSRKHNLIAAAYYTPLYLLALFGIIDALRGADDVRRRVVDATLLWILSVAAFSAATILDFDFRYRLPLMPQIIVLSALGVDALLRRVAAHRQSLSVRSTT